MAPSARRRRPIRDLHAMNRFFEYTTNHPFLVAAAAILAVLAIVFELRQRARGGNSIGTTDAVRLANSRRAAGRRSRQQGLRGRTHHRGAHIPAAEIASRAESLKKFKEKPVIVYCDGGSASGGAARTLRASGFNKVVTLSGGLQSWRQDNLPLVKGAAQGRMVSMQMSAPGSPRSQSRPAKSSCIRPTGAATASARAMCSSAKAPRCARSRSTKSRTSGEVMLQRSGGRRTVPQIFIGERHVGRL